MIAYRRGRGYGGYDDNDVAGIKELYIKLYNEHAEARKTTTSKVLKLNRKINMMNIRH
jgi:hypothetical protein